MVYCIFAYFIFVGLIFWNLSCHNYYIPITYYNIPTSKTVIYSWLNTFTVLKTCTLPSRLPGKIYIEMYILRKFMLPIMINCFVAFCLSYSEKCILCSFFLQYIQILHSSSSLTMSVSQCFSTLRTFGFTFPLGLYKTQEKHCKR